MSHVIVVPVRRPVMTANDQRRWHWTKVRKAKAMMQQQTWAYAKLARIPTLSAPIRLTVTWYPPDNIHRDHDALSPFLKAAQDALVEGGWIQDDNSAHVPSGATAIGPVDRDNPRIEITIEETP